MKVKLYVEVEVDDLALVQAYGVMLPKVTAAFEIHAGVARAIERAAAGGQHGIQHVTRAKAIFLPELLP